MNVRGTSGTIIPGFRVFLYLNTEKVLCAQTSLLCINKNHTLQSSFSNKTAVKFGKQYPDSFGY